MTNHRGGADESEMGVTVGPDNTESVTTRQYVEVSYWYAENDDYYHC